MRAGVSAVRALPWQDPQTADPLKGARVSMPHRWFGVGMLADMITPAISECLAAAGDERPDGDAALSRRVRAVAAWPPRTAELEVARLGARPTRDRRESALRADRARSGLVRRRTDCCARAVAHRAGSLCHRRGRGQFSASTDVEALHRSAASHEQRQLQRVFSVRGGLRHVARARRPQRPGRAAILGIGCAIKPIESTEPFRPRGMTRAVRQALDSAGLTMREVAVRLSDLSGKHYKFKEATFAAGRLNRVARDASLELWHPIEYLSEIGAAILPCLPAPALHARQHSYGVGRVSQCHVGSDAGERAAIVLRYEGCVEEDEL